MIYQLIRVLVALYVIGAIRVGRLCFKEAHLYPNWYEPNFVVPTLTSIIGWPIFLIIAWVRVTWAFFAKGHL